MTILLLASILCLVGCQRSASSGTAPAGAANQPASLSRDPASAASGAASDGAPVKPAANQEIRGSAVRPAAVSPAVSPAPTPTVDTGVIGLLSQGAQDGTLPEDFEIGPLGAARLLRDDERAAFNAARSLLDAFARGRVDRTVLAADSRDALAGTIAFALERADPPVSWRLGPPRANGSELVANLRLLGKDGSAEGELYARREGEEFRISDLQIDPARMQVRRERSGRTFFPSPYRWLLGG
jgi:hypothetical protein